MAEERIAPAPTTAAPPGTTAAGTNAPGTTTSETVGTASRPAGQQQEPFNMFYMIVPMIIVFWLFIIRPEKKRQAQQKELLNAVKKNDKIILAGVGMYGEVAEVEGDEVTVIIDKKKDVRVKVRKEAIGGIVNTEEKK